MLFAAVGVQVLGSETEETNLRTLLLPCYLQLLGWRCWGARRRRRICGRCCCHAICSFWGGGAGERDYRDESADAAVAMLFAAVGVEVLGSETTETNLRTLLLPCYLQLLGCRCWGARRRRRICGRCCYHAICSCWGAGAGERDGGDESADAAVTMLFAAVGVEVLGSETEGTNLRTLLLPCYLQLLGWRCWGARLPRRICGRCCYHAICSCWGAGAGERDYRDESADAAVAMLFAAVGVEVLGSETTETNLRTLLLPCYLQLLGCRCWGARRRRRICGRCCYHAICSCWGAGAGERDGGDESADAAVTMLFAAVGVEGVEVLGSETTETNLRTLLLLCYLQLSRCWGARLPRRICGRCCYHAICSCWGAGAGERDGGDESADAAVTMLFAAVGVQVLGSETEETNLRTLLLPCYLQLLGWRCWGARRRGRICGRCCCHAICSCWGGGAGSETTETNLRTLLLPCYLQLLRCRYWGARRRIRICGRCCYHAFCSCWGGGADERDYRDESADAAVAMLFAAVAVQVLGSETEETNLRTLLLPCFLQLLGWRCCWRRRICGRCCYHAICSETEETNLRTLLLPCYLQLLGWSCWGARWRRGPCYLQLQAWSCWGAIRRRARHLPTLLLPCYLQLLGWRCWGARLPRRICGRCCCHAICSCWGAGAGERDGGDESADAAVTMLFAAVGVQVLGSETEETNLRTLLFPCYLQLLGWSCWGTIRRRRICGRCCSHAICSCCRCWGARRRRRICGRCCYHAICSCWGAGAGERDGGDAAVIPCYLQLLGCRSWGAIRRRRCRCWGARRRRWICGRCCSHAICSCWGGAAGERDGGGRRICGRCCCHAICGCWGGGAGERDYRDESADAAVAMLFAAVAVQVLGSETEETNLRTLLLPCYLQLLGWRCWGARRRRRICGRCCYHAICSCKRGAAGDRYGGDASADAAVPMLFAAVRVEVLGSDTEETNLRTLLLPCYLQLLGWRCWGARRRRRIRICGRCCCHAICSCWGGGAGERDYRDESADAAVAMLFAAVGVQVPGSEMEETNLRTLLLPCYLQLLGCRCWGARRRRRICGRCCSHAICSCWGGAAGERDGGDESADAAVPMLFAAIGVEVLGSEAEDESADAAVTMLFAAVGVQVLGSETEETNLRTLLLPCYLQLLGCRWWGAIRRRRICGRCCYHAICSCWGAAAGERDGGDESADGVVAMLFAAVGVEVLGSETAETNLRTVLLPCYLQLLGWRCWGARLRRRICGRCCYHAINLQLLGCSCWGAIRRRRICGRCCCHAICSCWGAAAGERDCGDEVADAAVTMRIGDWGRRRRSCGRWWWRMLLFKQAEFKGSGFWTPYFLISKSFFYRGRLF